MKEMTLKEIQETELSLMAEFDRICEKEGFRYSLHGGTLLGAIRHKGFIPWDDDLDVFMPREDYEKFLDYCIEKETSFGMVSIKNDREYSLLFARIFDRNTIIKGEHLIGLNHGVYIDITPFDYIGKDLNYLKNKRRLFCKTQYWGLYKRNPLSHFLGKKNILKDIRTLILYPFKYFISNKEIENRILKPFRKFNKENSDYVSQLVLIYAHRIYYKKSVLDEYIKTDFEGHKFSITKEYDYLLKEMFGDYMQLPPEKDRQPAHEFDAFVKEEL